MHSSLYFRVFCCGRGEGTASPVPPEPPGVSRVEPQRLAQGCVALVPSGAALTFVVDFLQDAPLDQLLSALPHRDLPLQGCEQDRQTDMQV